MNIEDVKKIAREEFMNNVMEHLDSALIFAYIQNLENQLQQKENIIKEVREYIETEYLSKFDDFEKPLRMTDKNDWNKLLEILDKEVN